MGWIKEERELNQKHYGWYCADCKRKQVIALSYDDWKEKGCPLKHNN